MQSGVEKKNDFQKLLGGNHILNIEVVGDSMDILETIPLISDIVSSISLKSF